MKKNGKKFMIYYPEKKDKTFDTLEEAKAYRDKIDKKIK